MKKFVAPLVCLAILACMMAAFRAPACQPSERAIAVPRPVPKSLVIWWEYSMRSGETDGGWNFNPHWQSVAWYAGSVSPENLIARRLSPGRLKYGPAALDTPYRIAWRGSIDGRAHYKIEAPEGISIEQLRSELATFETEPLGDIELTTSSVPQPASLDAAP